MLSIGGQSKAGGKLDAFLMKVERPTHASKPVRRIEPHESVPIVPRSARPPLSGFVNQREPAAIKSDRLRATPEFLGCYRGDGFGDRSRLLVHYASRIAQGDESQLVVYDLRHPILLVASHDLFLTQDAPVC